jgi:molybdate transport system regulatory protein
MRAASKEFRIRSKVWVEDARGKLVLGPGRLRIFDSIQRTGSIHAAAKELGIGYRAIWGKIKATEQRLGKRLLVRSVGGFHGGGSQLTPKAVALVEAYRIMQDHLADEANKFFENTFEGILSGRNQ